MLFSIYTRAAPSVCSPTPSIQFADDIALHDSNYTAAVVSTSLSAAASRLSSWLDRRGLILHPTKSKVATVLPHRQMDGQVEVLCNGTVLPSATSTTYLGVIIDAKLLWNPHFEMIITKAARKIGALWRSRRAPSGKSRRMFIQAVIMPDLLHGSNAFFAGPLGRQLDRLRTLQHRAIRAIDGNPPHSAIQSLLTKNSLFRFAELGKRNLLVFVWRQLRARISPSLTTLISRPTDRRTSCQQTGGLLSKESLIHAGKSWPTIARVVLWNLLPKLCGPSRGSLSLNGIACRIAALHDYNAFLPNSWPTIFFY